MLDVLAAFAQAALYVGIVGACGAVFAEVTLGLDTPAVARLRRLMRTCASVLVIAVFAGGVILIQRLGGEFDGATLSALFVSNVGAALGLRVTGAGLLLLTIGDTDDSFSRGMRLSYAGVIVSSFLFSGHGAAEGVSIGLMTCVHVSIASWWVGALIAMRTVYAGDNDRFGALVRRFSRHALIAIGLLIAAGTILIVVLLDWTALRLTPYVQLLMLKLVLAACVLGLAAYNKFRITPRLTGAHAIRAAAALRAMIGWELLAIVGVLVATAVLTTYSSPHD